MVLHRKVVGRHPPINWKFVDADDRLAKTDFDEFDEGGFGWQESDDSVWFLSSIDPITWKQLSISEDLIDINSISFNTEFSGETDEGKINWNPVDFTLDVGTINGSVIQVGQEVVVIVRNNTANDMHSGQAVYYTGTVGKRPTVGLANATNPNSSRILGIVTQDIPKNNVGLVTVFGEVRDCDTSAFNDGDIVFVSETADGELQTTQPLAPNATVILGVILYAHASDGIICVRSTIYQRLTHLNDVNIRTSTLNNNHFLKYEESNSSWGKKEMPWLVDDYDPTGFHRGIDNKGSVYDGKISFDEGTRTFTIEPDDGQSEFWFYTSGTKHTKTSAQEIVISNDWAVHAIYFDNNGDLQTTTAITTEIIVSYAFVAYIYWDPDNSEAVVVADERHGYHMSGKTHLHLHRSYGAQYYSGLDIGDLIVDGSGTLETTIQFSTGVGEIADEDVVKDIPAKTAPAQIPILYRLGVNGYWKKKAADNYPLIYNGTADYSGTLPPYNYYNGSQWVLAPATNNDYIIMVYVATTDANQPIVGVQSQAIYTNLNQARLGMYDVINTLAKDGMAFVEYVACWGLIVQVSSSFTNTPKAIFRSLDTGEDYMDFRTLRSGLLIT